MEERPTKAQGRARGLYDEQLQRQQQEKLLFKGGKSRPRLLSHLRSLRDLLRN